MPNELDTRLEQYRKRLAAVGQDQVLRFWRQLNDCQRRELLSDLDQVDIERVAALLRDHLQPRPHVGGLGKLEPAPFLRARPDIEQVGRYADAVRRGQDLISEGKVAALTVAGGQGTRLGFDGPKGAMPVSPVKGKSLFHWFAETVLAVGRRYGCRLPWYIMTSPANDAATKEFFRQHNWFDLPAEDVTFFQQGVMPAFDREGRVLLADRSRLALSPDGHGGTLLALDHSGALADMARRGVEYISYFQVDNPLVKVVDPLFIGLHAASGSEMSGRCLPKSDDFERVGNFAISDGKLTVIEYSDLPPELARARNEDGSRRYDAGSPAIHVLSRTFVEGLTAEKEGFGLPWHRAEKKVSYVDDAGRRVDPDQPNGIKLETFIFDALPLAKNPLILQTTRAEQFSPVKNASGSDSLQTAQRDIIRRTATWLEAAGCHVPRRSDGEPDAVIEISPLLALDPDELCEKLTGPPSISRGQQVYLE
jgi:UDP-N-acetylglucosamine/UDP-N-acetylgalactosamine diphosphorylase